MRKALAFLFACCCLAALLIVVAATSEPKRTAPTSPRVGRSATPGIDLGAGRPGALCSSNRRGMWFESAGSIYVCGGPKPYRWNKEKSWG